MKVLIEISYKGTNYCGWQAQKNGISVQEILQKALSIFFKQNIILYASGRTDAGVHARSQFAHFNLDKQFDVSKIPVAIQNLLPNDISVTNAVMVDDDFHARYAVVCKTYYYRWYISSVRQPLKDEFMSQLKKELDFNEMKKACKYFVGRHNFKAFCIPRKLEDENFEREIFNCDLKQNNDEVTLEITGTGFLHNMVRIIAGTLIEVGKGKIKPEDIQSIMISQDRAKAGKTLEAKGLMLYDVSYGESIDRVIKKL